MTEDFLAYVWKHQYFDKTNLQTAAGEELQILKTGFLNTHAGPDYKEASLKIGEIIWNGSVEFHLKASDWQKHRHTTDQKYDQVILHVVWENDQEIARTNNSVIPVLELRNRVAPGLLETFSQLQKPKPTIPCEPFLAQVREITKTAMLERTLLERLENKAFKILEKHKAAGNNWNETTYAALLTGFGFKINQAGFEKLAQSLPFKILLLHRHNAFQTEALLFGQAGFLDKETSDSYIQKLQTEYRFLQHKYNLAPTAMQRADWNFLRLRPANFPTVRLAQLAALITKQEHWFAGFLAAASVKDFQDFFRATLPSEYWQTHYLPGKAGKLKTGRLGKTSVDLLLINVIAPLLFAYGTEMQQQQLIEKSIGLLEKLPPENNTILAMYENLQFENNSAARSQGLLQLYHFYCRPVNCLNCAIGNSILKRSKAA